MVITIKRKRRRERITPLQTHLRAFKRDKLKLKGFMRRNNIKSEALAIRRIFKRLK